ncbi:P63C domain-containing protein [Alienimonas sp. DA493]|uniref:P63C domain-containing protein n=1 Tax=Alienimonas sp. DA493 TaxID=3373605 RepID=UPI003754035E
MSNSELTVRRSPKAEMVKPKRAVLHDSVPMGDLSIDGFYTEDGDRLFSDRGVADALAISRQSGTAGGVEIDRIASQKRLSPYFSRVRLLASKSVPFTHPKGGGVARGLPIEVIPAFASAMIIAKARGATTRRHERMVEKAIAIQEALLSVAINIVFDDALGIRSQVAEGAYAALYNYLLMDHPQQRVSQCRDNYLREMCKLNRLSYPRPKGQTPRYFGHVINETLYDPLAPGLKAEFDRLNPNNENGQRRFKNYQFLTDDALKEFLAHQEKVTQIARPFPWGGMQEFRVFIRDAFDREKKERQIKLC